MLLGNIPWTHLLQALLVRFRDRLAVLHRGESGYSTEAVIVTALLVLAAITALGYITTKVISKAKGLSLE